MLKGIDVSYAQGNIDFSKLNKNEVHFSIIRSSFGWESGQKDNQFERNYTNFKKLGIPIGAYHYSYATNAEEGKKEADYCYQCIKGKTFELPIYFDIEDNSVIKYGKRNLTDAVIAFCEQMKKYGYRVGVYTNPSWLNSYLYKDEIIGKYNIWLAHWGASSPAYTCGVWQYGVGGRGSLSGISGEIDLDYLMDNNLISKNTTNTTTKPKQETKTTTTTVTVNDRDKFLDTARSYIGKNGYYVCNTKLGLTSVVDWCAYSISAIMKDCNFIGKYQGGIYGYASDNAREDNGKYGTWFKKGDKAPQPEDLIMFRYAGFINPLDKYSASHVGIVEKVNGNTITTLEGNVQGNNYNWAETSTFARCTRYLSDDSVYSFFRPNWKSSTVIKTTTNTTNTSTTKTTNSGNVDVTYKVHTCKRWQPSVKNTEDYAGVENCTIKGVYMKPSKGHLRYRVRLLNGRWLPWVQDYEDFAGANSLNVDIDCIQVELVGLSEYTVEYRVSTTKSTGYLPWVREYNNNNDDGYAGIKGSTIDKLQIRIVKK